MQRVYGDPVIYEAKKSLFHLCTTLHLHLVFFFPTRILLQDHETFQDVCEWNELLCRQLRALSCAQPHWRLMCLESRYCAWLARLPYNIHGLSDTHGDWYAVELFVERNEEAWVHRRHKEIKHPVVLVKNN